MSTFLSSPYYQEVRTLICNERVRLANCHLRFDGIDGRFLLAGAADCTWSDGSEQFVPRESWFDGFLTDHGALRVIQMGSSSDLLQWVGLLKPMSELLTLQQGDVIGGVRVLTEVCLFRPASGPVLLSELRQGREGFDFECDEAELTRRFEHAESQEVRLLDGDAFRLIFHGLGAYAGDFKNLHNRSLRADPVATRDALHALIAEKSEKVAEYAGPIDQLPTFFALKYCGPVCWYFNRIIQSVHGLQAQFGFFDAQQIELVVQMDRQSQICRNLGLMAGRKSTDQAVMSRLKASLDKLISQVVHLDQLIVD